MKPVRKISRRSFMARVAGGAVVGGGAMMLVTDSARAFQVSDADPVDPAGRGRGGPGNRIRGCTDGDRGTTADPAGHGRGNNRTDSDSGPGSDPARCGRR